MCVCDQQIAPENYSKNLEENNTNKIWKIIHIINFPRLFPCYHFWRESREIWTDFAKVFSATRLAIGTQLAGNKPEIESALFSTTRL